ncbi:GspS/AspS pilotin family protein [Vibrio zhugei]|uniref:GspS/AspS pilotin family protein n=1 Tax=Vibrio zhugei TaxID=2479546 RepID=A0ABV7CE92_9VIBR|nr:GspS/AspS pilotin family protein [Vibrio zhugei]
MKIRTLGAVGLIIALLAGCSSANKDQKRLEMIATNRAALLSSELPLQYGPLHIMRANSRGSMIEMMMVYNTDAAEAKPVQDVMTHSAMSFCQNPTISDNLTQGIDYRIKIRDSRGKLLIDNIITDKSCDKLLPKK